MARNRSSAKKAGTMFETEVCTYLSAELGMKITRMPKTGSKDVGDIHNVHYRGEQVAVECKNPGRDSSWKIAEWWRETEIETANLDTRFGVLMVRQYGKKVEHAICIMDSVMWESGFSIPGAEPVLYTGAGFGKWGEQIAEHTVISAKKRGSDDLWIATSLTTFKEILDSKNTLPQVFITENDMESLLQGEAVVIRATNGDSVTVSAPYQNNG